MILKAIQISNQARGPRAFGALLGIVALSACARAIGPTAAPGGLMDSRFLPAVTPATAFNVLYNFESAGDDGIVPFTSLTRGKSGFYGTTSGGGPSKMCSAGCGTVFTVTGPGKESVIYNFGSYTGDGIHPHARLVQLKGTFYGTTRNGGLNARCKMGCGTVFSVTPAGNESVLYSFGSYKGDGTNPVAGLTVVGDKLYGTTLAGGAKNHGSVFSITTAGGESVIYPFGSYKHDGLDPAAPVIAVTKMLYGTTTLGGSKNKGALYRMKTDGTETVIHSFGRGKNDGADPHSGLIYVGGELYGTTAAGGSHNDGTVFESTLNGIEGPLYSFGTGHDGKTPRARVTYSNGVIYGTTSAGGANNYGTVFSVNMRGIESVLNSFDGTHGAYPYAEVLPYLGKLYGTTAYGGSGTGCTFSKLKGCGTVFELTP